MPKMHFPFTLAADPGTDLWKKPPSTDDSNAPTRPHSIAPLAHLVSATITFSLPYTCQYDQAGLVLKLHHPPTKANKWIKAGVEFYNNAPRLSVVCCDQWADWSVASFADPDDKVRKGKKTVTIMAERDGTTLWIYRVDGAERTPLREIAWVYAPDGTGESWEVEVGALVARPNKDTKEQLEATFHDMHVEWKTPCENK